ncbi:MAG TPA: basic amino acid ABC transporter substrate-binding protein [Candidatus Saccharimonadales bacterium]|nr:basic amino acid ABC transporter substrate-binding protein [Candidatus Saccharimonadales bacterium]
MENKDQSSPSSNSEPVSEVNSISSPQNSTTNPSTPTDVNKSSTPESVSSFSSPTTPSTPPPSQPASGKHFPWVILLIILLLGFLSFAAFYFHTQLQKMANPSTTSNQTTTTTLPKTLVIGIDPTFQPMEYTQNGKMVGYDVDLANLLSKQLGVKVVFKNIIFDNLFTALQNQQINMIISAVTITPERQKKYDFSEAYLNAGQVIITQKNNVLIKSPTDLKGKKIGVQQGTTDESEALKYTSQDLVIRYADFVQATKALVDGKVDAIVTDLPSAQGIVSTNPTLKISSDPFTNDYYGIVFRKGDPNVKQINKALDSLRVRGFLTDLKHKWLD